MDLEVGKPDIRITMANQIPLEIGIYVVSIMLFIERVLKKVSTGNDASVARSINNLIISTTFW